MPANILSQYVAQVQSLLDDAAAAEYTTGNLTTFINDARVQIAGASESIRTLAAIQLTAGVQNYSYTAFAVPPPTGAAGVLALRKGRVLNGGDWQEIISREWEVFFSYQLTGSNAGRTGVPSVFAEQTPGVAGTFYVNPIPDVTYQAQFDVVAYPIPLASDVDPEIIPYPWTEAIQYFAAYLAYLSRQREADADAMFQRYQMFEMRGTQMATPTVTPDQQLGGAGAARAAQHMPIPAPRGQGQGR